MPATGIYSMLACQLGFIGLGSPEEGSINSTYLLGRLYGGLL